MDGSEVEGADFSESGSEYTPESDKASYSSEDENILETETVQLKNMETDAENHEDPTTTTSRGRKRSKNEENWKRNKNKTKRIKGDSYLNRSGKTIPKKILKTTCCKCARKCTQSVSLEEREHNFKYFYKLDDHVKQNIFIRGLVKNSPVKHHRARDSSRNPKSNSFKYFLRTAESSVQVCKKFFIDTFQISDARVYKCCNSNEVSAVIDGRGHREPGNKINVSKVEEHIRSFPSYKSHYTRSENPDRRYLRSDLNIHKMYLLYAEKCKDENVLPVKEKMYYHVFSTKFNLHFKPPAKDTCQLCDSLQQTIIFGDTPEVQNNARTDKELHLRKAAAARKSMTTDKSLASDDIYVFTFDLEKALAFPKLTCSTAYYKTNLYIYNFGCHSFNTNTGYMHIWNETQGSRGSQEVSACLVKHLKQYASTYTAIIMYSDSCTGQNRNIKLALTLLKLIQDPEMTADYIDHKFLVSGHSYLPNDADFGIIENKAKKMQQIFGPNDWIELIKSAKTNNPFKTTEMITEDFLSTELLEHAITNRKKNTIGGKVNWLNIRWLRYRKNSPNSIFYKESLQEDVTFLEIDIKKAGKIGRPINWTSISQEPVYKQTRTVKPLKQKHMLELLKYIPPVYHRFYRTLQSDQQQTRSKSDGANAESDSGSEYCD